MGPFPPCERCRSMWPEIEFSFGNHRIHSDTSTYLAYSCQEQGPGGSPGTWTKCMNLSSLPLAGHSATCFVSNTRGEPFGWKLWRWSPCYQLESSPGGQTLSQWLQLLPEKLWIKVTNIHKKKMPCHHNCILIHYERITYVQNLAPYLPLAPSISCYFLFYLFMILFDHDLKPELSWNLFSFPPPHLSEYFNFTNTWV